MAIPPGLRYHRPVRGDGPGATTPEQPDAPDAEVRLEPYLFVVLDYDRPLAGGARYALSGIDRVSLGRGQAVGAQREERDGQRHLDLRLPSSFLSTRHARLQRAGDTFLFED